MISKTIIVTLEGNTSRRANQVGVEKHKLQIFAQILLQMRVDEHQKNTNKENGCALIFLCLRSMYKHQK